MTSPAATNGAAEAMREADPVENRAPPISEAPSGASTGVGAIRPGGRAEILEDTVTQDGVAKLFAERHAEVARFCHDSGRWYVWLGTHWQRDDVGQVLHRIRLGCRESS